MSEPTARANLVGAKYGAGIFEDYPDGFDVNPKLIDGETKMTILATGWAVVRPDGTISVDVFPGATEAEILWMTFGRRDRIEAAKARGAKAFRCEVREIGGEG